MDPAGEDKFLSLSGSRRIRSQIAGSHVDGDKIDRLIEIEGCMGWREVSQDTQRLV